MPDNDQEVSDSEEAKSFDAEAEAHYIIAILK